MPYCYRIFKRFAFFALKIINKKILKNFQNNLVLSENEQITRDLTLPVWRDRLTDMYFEKCWVNLALEHPLAGSFLFVCEIVYCFHSIFEHKIEHFCKSSSFIFLFCGAEWFIHTITYILEYGHGFSF